MTLPVRIEAKAWTDSRYATVALHLGLAAGDAEIALIRCAAIWRWQTEHYTDAAPTYVVPEGVVVGALKSLDGPRALVAAGLAELADGGLRIKGGKDDNGKSRIDWYYRDRQQRREAGVASGERRRKAGDPRTADGRLAPLPPQTTNGRPTADQRTANEPPTETERKPERPPSSPDSGLRTQDPENTHTARAIDQHRAVALEMHDAWCEAGRRLKAETGRAVMVGGAMPDPRHLEMIRPVVEAWSIVAAGDGRPLPDVAREQMARLVAVRVAKAKAMPDSLRWWSAPSFWPIDGIEKDLADDPEAVAARVRGRPGHGARDSPPGTGYGRPAAHHDTGTIDPKTIRPRT